MRCLVALAHPLEQSLSHHFADVACDALRAAGHHVLKTGGAGACAPKARFDMLTLYSAENPTAQRVKQHASAIRAAMTQLGN
jgi:putative NADPH-quinone reductase